MKRLDDGKVSLVEFMRSIKFTSRKGNKRPMEVSSHFANLKSQAHRSDMDATEDCSSVRSGN